jgi:hypothetical protein
MLNDYYLQFRPLKKPIAMKFSTVSDDVLSKATLIAKNERVYTVSIFPFFNTSGRVKQLMILLPGFKTVCMIPYKNGLASVSFLGTVKLSMDLAQIDSHANFSSKQVDQLFHYDPNWHLSDERFVGYWAKNLIKQSNCADQLDDKIRNLKFSKDLSLLDHFEMKSGFLNMFKTITPEMLLGSLRPIPLETGNLSQSATGGWRLQPIWKGWGRH